MACRPMPPSYRGTSTTCRLFAQVDFRREMRPLAFIDPAAFPSTDLAKLTTTRLFGQPRSKRWLYERCIGIFRHISSAYSLPLHPKTGSAESNKTIFLGLPLLHAEGATGCTR